MEKETAFRLPSLTGCLFGMPKQRAGNRRSHYLALSVKKGGCTGGSAVLSTPACSLFCVLLCAGFSNDTHLQLSAAARLINTHFTGMSSDHDVWNES